MTFDYFRNVQRRLKYAAQRKIETEFNRNSCEHTVFPQSEQNREFISEIQNNTETELENRTLISKFILKSQVPREFPRKPRPSDKFNKSKGTEFRLFLFYTGPLLLLGILNNDHYNRFLKIHCAIRILYHKGLCKEWIYLAKTLLLDSTKDE